MPNRNTSKNENVQKIENNNMRNILLYGITSAVISIIFYIVTDVIFYENSPAVQLNCESQVQAVPAPIPVNSKRLKYWHISLENWNKNGNLRTMNRVFEKLGYEFVNASEGDDFDIMWSLEHYFYENNNSPVYPLNETKLKPHQKVNHFPGNNFLVGKSVMCTENRHLPYILPAFRPNMMKELKQYIKENPKKMFVQKNYYNRGVKIIDAENITNNVHRTFYQVFLDNPFLVDGHAVDMGVFVLIASIDPLRVYRFNEEILLRFCPEKYYPFDKDNRMKYVVSDNHLPTYEMSIFNETYKKYKPTFKSLFEDYITDQGLSVEKMWQKVDDAIARIIITSKKFIVSELKKYDLSSKNFFEIVRFDFVHDNTLHPYAMEVNMSPNMTPAEDKFEENSLIYEQIINNVVNMIGGGSYQEFMGRLNNDTTIVNDKNIAVDIKRCELYNCAENCSYYKCELCRPCLNDDMRYELSEAYRESLHSANFKRVFPTEQHFDDDDLKSKLSYNDELMLNWYEQKCWRDKKWC